MITYTFKMNFQILMDRLKTTYIQISASAPDLDIDLDIAKHQGPYPDLIHHKMSYMCSRILLETKQQVIG